MHLKSTPSQRGTLIDSQWCFYVLVICCIEVERSVVRAFQKTVRSTVSSMNNHLEETLGYSISVDYLTCPRELMYHIPLGDRLPCSPPAHQWAVMLMHIALPLGGGFASFNHFFLKYLLIRDASGHHTFGTGAAGAEAKILADIGVGGW